MPRPLPRQKLFMFFVAYWHFADLFALMDSGLEADGRSSQISVEEPTHFGRGATHEYEMKRTRPGAGLSGLFGAVA
jgi:hypothetical protein